MANYLDATRYNELVQALLTGSMDEQDRENAIKIALGELTDVWPDVVEHRSSIIGLNIQQVSTHWRARDPPFLDCCHDFGLSPSIALGHMSYGKETRSAKHRTRR